MSPYYIEEGSVINRRYISLNNKIVAEVYGASADIVKCRATIILEALNRNVEGPSISQHLVDQPEERCNHSGDYLASSSDDFEIECLCCHKRFDSLEQMIADRGGE